MPTDFSNLAFPLVGKRILVTGATSGIGLSTCHGIAAAGGQVIGLGRVSEKLNSAMSKLTGSNHQAIVCDLAQPEGVAKALSSLEPIDGVVYSAGVVIVAPVRFANIEKLHEVFRVNFDGFLGVCRYILRRNLLNPCGSIVVISSVLSRTALVGNGLYSASKAAVEALVRVMAIEIAGNGSRVNAVAPGFVRTPMTDALDKWMSPEQIDKHELEYPLGFGKPSDVAHTVLFLLSDASRWITGTTIVTDGGFSLR